MKIRSQNHSAARVSDFLGSGLKRLALDDVDIDGEFINGSIEALKSDKDIEAYERLYCDYIQRESINLYDLTPGMTVEDYFQKAITSETSISLGVRNDSGNLLVALCLDFRSLPRDINKAYFGLNFEKFAYLERFAVADGVESKVVLDICSGAINMLRALQIKCLLFHADKNHKTIINGLADELKAKKISGSNFLSGNDLFCITL